MADQTKPHRGTQATLPRIYSPSLQPLYQSLLATLANMDMEYERDVVKIRASSGDGKRMMLEKLKERHRERREPYIQQLAILQDRIQQGWH